MTELFHFSDSVNGLACAAFLTLSLRRAGFKTCLVPVVIASTRLFQLRATPRPRPNRKARGCSLWN